MVHIALQARILPSCSDLQNILELSSSSHPSLPFPKSLCKFNLSTTAYRSSLSQNLSFLPLHHHFLIFRMLFSEPEPSEHLCRILQVWKECNGTYWTTFTKVATPSEQTTLYFLLLIYALKVSFTTRNFYSSKQLNSQLLQEELSKCKTRPFLSSTTFREPLQVPSHL